MSDNTPSPEPKSESKLDEKWEKWSASQSTAPDPTPVKPNPQLTKTELVVTLGCTCIVIFAIIWGIGKLFGPNDPNYESGKAAAIQMIDTEADYGAVTGTPQHHTSGQSLELARTQCPENLTGEAREEWIKGFTDYY